MLTIADTAFRARLTPARVTAEMRERGLRWWWLTQEPLPAVGVVARGRVRAAALSGCGGLRWRGRAGAGGHLTCGRAQGRVARAIRPGETPGGRPTGGADGERRAPRAKKTRPKTGPRARVKRPERMQVRQEASPSCGEASRYLFPIGVRL